jgi:hypothetical protein
LLKAFTNPLEYAYFAASAPSLPGFLTCRSSEPDRYV